MKPSPDRVGGGLRIIQLLGAEIRPDLAGLSHAGSEGKTNRKCGPGVTVAFDAL
jgi:hypothetical protein